MTATKPKMKFRILHGCLTEPGPNKTNVFHPRGSVIETDIDLCGPMFNPPISSGMAQKYERVPDHTLVTSRVPIEGEVAAPVEQASPAEAAPAPSHVENPNALPAGILQSIDSMTLKELTEYAAAEEIDINGAKKLEDIRRIVKAATKP